MTLAEAALDKVSAPAAIAVSAPPALIIVASALVRCKSPLDVFKLAPFVSSSVSTAALDCICTVSPAVMLTPFIALISTAPCSLSIFTVPLTPVAVREALAPEMDVDPVAEEIDTGPDEVEREMNEEPRKEKDVAEMSTPPDEDDNLISFAVFKLNSEEEVRFIPPEVPFASRLMP